MDRRMECRPTLGLSLALVAACSVGSRSEPLPKLPLASTEAASEADRTLEQAVVRYHDQGDLDPLTAWLTAYPEHPDAEIWAEVVALRQYEEASLGEMLLPLPPAEPMAVDKPSEAPGPEYAADGPDESELPDRDRGALRDLAQARGSTLGGRMAMAVLEGERTDALFEFPVGLRVTRFLDGEPAWVGDGDDGPEARMDLERMQARYTESVRDRLAEALVKDGCWTQMGFCNWWVERYPDDPRTVTMREAMQAVWYRRGHPAWKGRNHGYCAHVCVKTCRPEAAPLDDGCFDPCYARCPESDPAAVLPPA